jgi:hypothetical protein
MVLRKRTTIAGRTLAIIAIVLLAAGLSGGVIANAEDKAVSYE